jgi:hypothetical protein|tara:strand:+ start:9635 stop:9862 length:228 start_codon:yes stop_codon:yes gene_type:complete
MSKARDRNYEESPSGQLEIKQLEKRIDELEAKNDDQSFRMREAARLINEVKTVVIRLEAENLEQRHYKLVGRAIF